MPKVIKTWDQNLKKNNTEAEFKKTQSNSISQFYRPDKEKKSSF